MNSNKENLFNLFNLIIKKKKNKKKLKNVNLFDYSKSFFLDHKIKYICI